MSEAQWPADTPGKGSGPGLRPGWPAGKCSGHAGSCARGQGGMISLGKIRSSETLHKHNCRSHITDNLHQCISRLSIQSFAVLAQILSWINRMTCWVWSCGSNSACATCSHSNEILFLNEGNRAGTYLGSWPDQQGMRCLHKGGKEPLPPSEGQLGWVEAHGLVSAVGSTELYTPAVSKTPAQAQAESSPKLAANWSSSCSIVLKAYTNKNSKTSSGPGPPFSTWMVTLQLSSKQKLLEPKGQGKAWGKLWLIECLIGFS